VIGRLKGVVEAIGEGHALIDVNGVGYEVHASAMTLRGLELGAAVVLAIETHVREDQIRLFAFTNEAERGWFRALQSVQGVGAKLALAVLGTLGTGELQDAIAFENWAAVERAPGVGRKLAQRVVAELKGKGPPLNAAAQGPGRGAAPLGASAAGREAVSALTNLGYLPVEAGEAVTAALRALGEAADTKSLIRRGLKELAR
jgi:Holliday junction DNA helicase RuvA